VTEVSKMMMYSRNRNEAPRRKIKHNTDNTIPVQRTPLDLIQLQLLGNAWNFISMRNTVFLVVVNIYVMIRLVTVIKNK
jgi:hypothetical protein